MRNDQELQTQNKNHRLDNGITDFKQFLPRAGLKPIMETDFVNDRFRAGGKDPGYDNLITFTRSSKAWYFDSNGVLQEAATDVARRHHHVYDGSKWVDAGLLVEQPRTRLTDYPRDYSSWVAEVSCAVSQDSVGIDGVSNKASTLTDDDSSADERIATGGLTDPAANTTYCAQFWVAKDNDTSRYPKFQFQFYGGTPVNHTLILNTQDGIYTEPSNHGNDYAWVEDWGSWWRVCLPTTEGDTTDNSGCRLYVYPANTDDMNDQSQYTTGSIVLDAVQAEKGDYPTIPIAIDTEGSTQSRSADDARMENIGSWLNNGGVGTILVEFRAPYWQYSPTYNRLIQIGGGELLLENDGGSPGGWWNIVADTATKPQPPSITDNNMHALILSIGDGDTRYVLDGGTVNSEATGPLNVSDLTMYIGKQDAVGRELSGTIKRIVYWPVGLSNTELKDKTT